MKQRKALAKIFTHYGPYAQLMKLAEECSELSAVICRNVNERNYLTDEFCEEFADVTVMLDQWLLTFDEDTLARIEKVRKDKIERTLGAI
jgi:NTP pyrophosphatase (non-canonical NTP hydrolase)